MPTQRSITVNLTNLNDNLPQINDATAPALPENSANGTAVYNINEAFTGTDNDRDGQPLAYSIIGGNTGGAFAIDPTTGAITVANSAALDFETTPVFNLTVQATDGATPDTAIITVNLINPDDNVPQINDATAPALPENSANGTAVYNVNEAFTGTDNDRDGQALAYSIIGGNTAAPSRSTRDRRDHGRERAALDFETTPVFNLTVQATDGDARYRRVTVNLTNLNDNAPQINDATTSLTENSPFGTPSTTSTRRLPVPTRPRRANARLLDHRRQHRRCLRDRPGDRRDHGRELGGARLRDHAGSSPDGQATDGTDADQP